MDTNKRKFYHIENGPSRDRLFDALKYAYDKDAKVDVKFDVALGYTAPKEDPNCAYITLETSDFVVGGICHDDGSGQSLIIRGYCRAAIGKEVYEPASIVGHVEMVPSQFEAHYNAHTRKGTITFKV